jgi:predicted dehydrogenase
MEILIYGFGRMGITHYSILNGIVPNANFTFIEPNKMLNLISKKNVKGNFLTSDEKINNAFDLTLITAPPFIHKELADRCISRGDKIVFIEKPFGGHSNSTFDLGVTNVFIGYVLRFNPIVNWIKNNVDPNDVLECSAKYLSNSIVNKPNGWRNGPYSGVLNEMGSHVLDMINYLFGIEDFEITKSEMNSIISDVDDEVSISLLSKKRRFDFYFNWVDKSLRKPVFQVSLKLKNNDLITFDQQKVVIENKLEEKTISVVDLNEEIPFYLRGVDFTKQMQDLTNKREVMCSLDEATTINRLMKEILTR